jgi:hypothetical protein
LILILLPYPAPYRHEFIRCNSCWEHHARHYALAKGHCRHFTGRSPGRARRLPEPRHPYLLTDQPQVPRIISEILNPLKRHSRITRVEERRRIRNLTIHVGDATWRWWGVRRHTGTCRRGGGALRLAVRARFASRSARAGGTPARGGRDAHPTRGLAVSRPLLFRCGLSIRSRKLRNCASATAGERRLEDCGDFVRARCVTAAQWDDDAQISPTPPKNPAFVFHKVA